MVHMARTMCVLWAMCLLVASCRAVGLAGFGTPCDYNTDCVYTSSLESNLYKSDFYCNLTDHTCHSYCIDFANVPCPVTMECLTHETAVSFGDPLAEGLCLARTCSSSGDCDDGIACNGVETCSANPEMGGSFCMPGFGTICNASEHCNLQTGACDYGVDQNSYWLPTWSYCRNDCTGYGYRAANGTCGPERPPVTCPTGQTCRWNMAATLFHGRADCVPDVCSEVAPCPFGYTCNATTNACDFDCVTADDRFCYYPLVTCTAQAQYQQTQCDTHRECDRIIARDYCDMDIQCIAGVCVDVAWYGEPCGNCCPGGPRDDVLFCADENCAADADCTLTYPGSPITANYCDGIQHCEDGRCSRTLDLKTCNEGEVCDPSVSDCAPTCQEGTCSSPTTVSDGSDVCTSHCPPTAPACIANMCYQCSTDSDCAFNTTHPVCDTTNNACVQCRENTDCDDGIDCTDQWCNPNHVCIFSENNIACTRLNELGECVSFCDDSHPFCNRDGACYACRTSADCNDVNRPNCDPDYHVCVCTASEPCEDDGKACTDDYCGDNLMCNHTPNCAEGEACNENGVCAPIGCSDDTDCAESTACYDYVCDTESGQCNRQLVCPLSKPICHEDPSNTTSELCVACDADTDCAGHLRCFNNGTVNAVCAECLVAQDCADPNNKCVIPYCAQGNICFRTPMVCSDTPEFCIDTRCEPETGTCVNVSHCRPGTYCVEALQQCYPNDCDEDEHCPDDGDPCNGPEYCDLYTRQCQHSDEGCDPAQICDTDQQLCVDACDTDSDCAQPDDLCIQNECDTELGYCSYVNLACDDLNERLHGPDHTGNNFCVGTYLCNSSTGLCDLHPALVCPKGQVCDPDALSIDTACVPRDPMDVPSETPMPSWWTVVYILGSTFGAILVCGCCIWILLAMRRRKKRRSF